MSALHENNVAVHDNGISSSPNKDEDTPIGSVTPSDAATPFLVTDILTAADESDPTVNSENNDTRANNNNHLTSYMTEGNGHSPTPSATPTATPSSSFLSPSLGNNDASTVVDPYSSERVLSTSVTSTSASSSSALTAMAAVPTGSSTYMHTMSQFNPGSFSASQYCQSDLGYHDMRGSTGGWYGSPASDPRIASEYCKLQKMHDILTLFKLT